MLIACYLALAATFYIVVAKRAPIMQELELVENTVPASCETIELFANAADQTASRAA